MASRELQELAELEGRISVSSSGAGRTPIPPSSRPPYRYDLSSHLSSTPLLPGRSVPYGLYNRPTGSLGQSYSRPFPGSSSGSGFSSSMRLTHGKDQPGRSSKLANLHRSMTSLNKSFIKKCASSTDSARGDPGNSLVPISLGYVSHTLKIILKHEEDDPSQNLLHLLDDIEASILQLSMEALSIRNRHDLLYSMQNRGTELTTTVARMPRTHPLAMPVVDVEEDGYPAAAGPSSRSEAVSQKPQPAAPKPFMWASTPLATIKEKDTPQTPGSGDSDNSFSRKRGRTDEAVPADKDKAAFRNPNAAVARAPFDTPLSVGIGNLHAPTKLQFDTVDTPRVNKFTTGSTNPATATATWTSATAPAPENKSSVQTPFGFFDKAAGSAGAISGKDFGSLSGATTTTESNNNLIKLPSTTSFTNPRPIFGSSPLFMPPPISTSTPTQNATPVNLFGAPSFAAYLNKATTAPTPMRPSMNHVAEKEDDDDEEEGPPPVNEFKPVEETDVIYETRVKVFEKSGKDFKDLGLGRLYVKDHPKGHHLFVRAENNLGTLLVNMILTDKIPLNRKTNNVVTVDPLGNDGKGTTYLIRVKNEEAATALKDKLDELKQKKRVNNNNNSKSTS